MNPITDGFMSYLKYRKKVVSASPADRFWLHLTAILSERRHKFYDLFAFHVESITCCCVASERHKYIMKPRTRAVADHCVEMSHSAVSSCAILNV